MMKLLGIDPGTELSAAVVYDVTTRLPVWWTKQPNEEILDIVDTVTAQQMAIERIASYGMSVGAEVFETCVWEGRFIERWLAAGGSDPARVYRRQVKSHLCGSQRATDTNIRQALTDRYGPGRERAVGRKASPGPLYGMKADTWAALAVAITATETMLEQVAA